MRTLCFIALVFLAFVVAGCRESAGKHFTEREAQLIDEYCTNDILGADAALAEMERLVRRDGHLVYASNGVPHQLGFIVARRSVIHSRLGDMTGATQFLEQAVILLRQAGHTNMTGESAVAYVEKLDHHLSVRWRQDTK